MSPIGDMQEDTLGFSAADIVAEALRASCPQSGLRWIDVGCGTGDALRLVRDTLSPALLVGIDVLPWLADDLRGDVDFRIGPAEEELAQIAPADRVILIESIEHFESPWTVLRLAARAVASGGRIVVSTPNIASLRNRLELGVHGRLNAFRPDHRSHLTPALPHVIVAVLQEEELEPSVGYAGADMLPLSRSGRRWPPALVRCWPPGLNKSLVVVGRRR